MSWMAEVSSLSCERKMARLASNIGLLGYFYMSIASSF